MYSESRAIGYGLAASVVVHLCVFVLVGIWVGVIAIPYIPTQTAEPDPEVTMLFAKDIMVEPAPPAAEKTPESAVPEPEAAKKNKARERYIRTTQNDEAEKAPEKNAFVSDKNTVASAKLAPAPGGALDMPTTKGIGIPTMELADRDYKDGEIKNDSAPSGVMAPPQSVPQEPAKVAEPPKPQSKPEPPTPPPAQAPAPVAQPPAQPPLVPQIKQPDPPPPAPPTKKPAEVPTPVPGAPQMAKKEDSVVEQQMKELEQSLAKADREHLPIEMRKPEPMTPDSPPEPKTEPQSQPEPKPKSEPPAEMAPPPPAPKAIPIAEPVRNTPKPEKNAFQPHTRTSENAGTISNMGMVDSVNAAATPTGRYMKRVTSAIEKKWHKLRQEKADFVEPGKLRLKFFVNKAGRPEDVSIVFNEANAVLTDFSLSAILLADIPPIPTDLLPILEKERVEMQYDIVIY